MVNSIRKILLLAAVFGFVFITTADACSGGSSGGSSCDYEITIKGTITDSSGKALPEVTVLIEKNDSGSWKSLGESITDSDGKYKIDKNHIIEKNDTYRMYLNGNLVATRSITGNMWKCTEYDRRCSCEEWKYKWDQINIPEFSTITMPIAAVIGLVFFFQHKKKEEE